MRVGYARTSTTEQVAGLEAQERDLRAAGCDETFIEQVSSVSKRRPKLEEALAYCRKGDEFVVAKPDRLARSLEDLLHIERLLRDKGVTLCILSMGLQTKDATSRVILQVMGAIAEFERALMLERQREGVAKAKAKGKYKGRKPTARAQTAEVLRLKSQGLKPKEVCEKVGISHASYYRIIKKAA